MAIEQQDRKRDKTTNAQSKPNTARRRLVSGSALAGAALPFLPAHWARPVVQKVLLPAHATMSEPRASEPIGPPCDLVVTLPSALITTCSAPLASSSTVYTFSLDSNNCLVYTSAAGSVGGCVNSNEINVSTSLSTSGSSGNQIVRIIIGNSGVNNDSSSECTATFTESGVTSYNMCINDVPAQATWTWTVVQDSVAISDVVVELFPEGSPCPNVVCGP